MNKLNLLIFLIAATLCGFGMSGNVEASASDNASGWAWSDSIGWVSFNSSNCDSDNNGVTDQGNYSQCPIGDSVVDYGVNISDITGALSGYAWSDKIGWIKFNPNGPYPQAPNYSAKMDLTSPPFRMTGWARACAGTVNGDCNSATRTDGWDGWIKLRQDSDNYGVETYDTATAQPKLRGSAWGSDIIGYLSFSCIDGGTCGAGPGQQDYWVETSFSFPKPITLDIEAKGAIGGWQDGPITIDDSESAGLRWKSKNADECVAEVDWSGQPLATSGWHFDYTSAANLIGPQTYTYKIICKNSVPAYDVTDFVDVIVRAPDGAVSLSANPTTINHGEETRLTWTLSDVDLNTCSASCNLVDCDTGSNWQGKTDFNFGFQIISNLTGPKICKYTIGCKDFNDTPVSGFVNVTVNVPVGALWIKANGDFGSTTIDFDTSAALTWGSANITPGSCSGSCVSAGGVNDCDPLPSPPDWIGAKPDFGSRPTDNLIGPDIYTYTIECDDLIGANVSASVDVNVEFSFPLPEWWEISPSF